MQGALPCSRNARPQKDERERTCAFLARRMEEGMEPDDLLCSRNARSRTPLVGRAQWKINQPPSLRDNERALREKLFRSMRGVKACRRLLMKRVRKRMHTVGIDEAKLE